MSVKPKRDIAETRKLILQSALKQVSRKGFNDATIRQIAQDAKVTALTVFRHFQDKENLFLSVVKEYKDISINEELFKDLSYKNIDTDLEILAKGYFRTLFENLDILRIFIGETNNNHKIREDAWFISPVLLNHFRAYLKAINLNPESEDMKTISEMFIAQITRRVLEYNKHGMIWSWSEEVAGDFIEKNKEQLVWIKSLI